MPLSALGEVLLHYPYLQGHLSKDCPKAKAAKAANAAKGCFTCGLQGHLSKDCPTTAGGESGGGNKRAKASGRGGGPGAKKAKR